MIHPIRVGIGGWNFEPWNETFYPRGLAAKRQLEYMSRKLTAVEVNATFYRTMPAATYARWAEEAPPGFVFSLKAHRFAVTRKTKDEMKTAIDWFMGSGVDALGDKLGPVNWQFQNKAFDSDYFDAFLSLLPKAVGGTQARHALEVRHPSYDDPRFFDLLTRHGHTVVWADDDEYPKLRHEGADFAVTRLMRTKGEEAAGYPEAEIDGFAQLFADWSKSQEVFAFFISGAKERNPAAAMALQEKLGLTPETAKEADELATDKPGPVQVKKSRAATPAKKAPRKKAATKAKKAPARKRTAAKATSPTSARNAAPRKTAARKKK
jgi:uncharacterized protein YecE (DUF72 family)